MEKTKAKDAGFLTEEQKKQFIKSEEAGIGIGHSVGYPFALLGMVIFSIILHNLPI